MNWLQAGIIFGLILLNGIFSGAELALVSARKARLRAQAEQGQRGARAALQLLEDPTRLLSTVQIGITLVGIFTGVYSGAVFAEQLESILSRSEWLRPYAEQTAFAVIVTLVTYLSLIFGELVPKRLALAHAETLASVVAIPMIWIARIAHPLVWLLQASTEAVSKLLPVKTVADTSVTEDEVRALIAAGARQGVFLPRERQMVEGVLRLADRSVSSVMVPRGDVVWLDVRTPLVEMWNEARASGHARFLLCDGDIEQLLGVITLADLGEAVRLGGLQLDRHVRPPLHVPSSVSLLRLLDLFRESSVHLAIVTGEYGEIEGVATPIDILKAIAGELPSMGSRERAEATQRADGSWLMDGQLGIHEVERILDRNDLNRGDDYHTLAGFMLWQLGRLPLVGETLTHRDLLLEVVDMDGPRIDKILVSKRRQPVPAESS
jgi:putative hemolysin